MPEDQPRPAADAALPERDDDVADIFRTMRKALALSPSALAQKLKTQTSVILALEKGELAELPEWEETSRVVTSYAAMMGLDCRPILRRIAIRKSEQETDDSEPAAAPTSNSRSAGEIAAISIVAILCLTLLGAFALLIMDWRTPDAAPPVAAPSAPAHSSPIQPRADGGPITVRRVPLPQAVEAPAAKDGVDPGPANSDNNQPSDRQRR